MIELQGQYNTAKIFTDNVDQETITQVTALLNQEFVKDSKIRIMPDCHQGAGCVIGTTMTITDKVVPDIVGVDIACSMLTTQLENKEIDLVKLDEVIHTHIPAGQNNRKEPHRFAKEIDLSKLICWSQISRKTDERAISSLGGGNHFISADKDEKGNIYIVIHTGSRNLGKRVAEYYQFAAEKALNDNSKEIWKTIERLKKEGRKSEIQKELKKLQKPKIDRRYAYCEGQLFEDYLHDIKIVQNFARLNRLAIIDTIISNMPELKITDQFHTVHNYIDIENMILRKGAISAQKGEKVLIPINMRDGCLIGIGKGNDDWNRSGPHGAGRLMSRAAAKKNLNLEDFKDTMKDVYSTTVGMSTIDEAPMAYKPIDEIKANIVDTVDVIANLKPIYNFKSA